MSLGSSMFYVLAGDYVHENQHTFWKLQAPLGGPNSLRLKGHGETSRFRRKSWLSST